MSDKGIGRKKAQDAVKSIIEELRMPSGSVPISGNDALRGGLAVVGDLAASDVPLFRELAAEASAADKAIAHSLMVKALAWIAGNSPKDEMDPLLEEMHSHIGQGDRDADNFFVRHIARRVILFRDLNCDEGLQVIEETARMNLSGYAIENAHAALIACWVQEKLDEGNVDFTLMTSDFGRACGIGEDDARHLVDETVRNPRFNALRLLEAERSSQEFVESYVLLLGLRALMLDSADAPSTIQLMALHAEHLASTTRACRYFCRAVTRSIRFCADSEDPSGANAQAEAWLRTALRLLGARFEDAVGTATLDAEAHLIAHCSASLLFDERFEAGDLVTIVPKRAIRSSLAWGIDSLRTGRVFKNVYVKAAVYLGFPFFDDPVIAKALAYLQGRIHPLFKKGYYQTDYPRVDQETKQGIDRMDDAMQAYREGVCDPLSPLRTLFLERLEGAIDQLNESYDMLNLMCLLGYSNAHPEDEALATLFARGCLAVTNQESFHLIETRRRNEAGSEIVVEKVIETDTLPIKDAVLDGLDSIIERFPLNTEIRTAQIDLSAYYTREGSKLDAAKARIAANPLGRPSDGEGLA